MNRTELVSRAAQTCGITKKEAESFTDAFLAALKDALSQGEKVTITNFGTFEVKQRKARVGRNPKTSQVVDIPPVKTPVFRPCPSLKKSIDK